MAEWTVAEFIIFPILIGATIGGFWYARSQAKTAQGVVLDLWKNG